MKPSRLPLAAALTRAFAGLALIGAAGLAAAQTPPPPETTPPPPATAATPTSKLVSSFSSFAGSEENAASLVNGLRTGSAITLTGTSTGPGGTPVGETTTFTSPTKPMGYGNIRIAMSLAEAQLASQGVTNPTPTQLQGALMGTTTGTGADATTTQGILQMRASGQGWGQIANSMGFKLGPVMSGKQTFTEAVAAGSTTTAGGTTAAGTTTARGKSGVTTAGGSSAGKGGVTTAGGSSPGKSGVTTAGGASAGKSGVTTAGGGGGGNAYGHSKSSVVTAAGSSGGAVATGLGHGNAGGASAGAVSAAGGGVGNSAGGGQGGGHGKGGGKP